MGKKGRPITLRVCASCEWIFKVVDGENPGHCPMCDFGMTYGAGYVYGAKAYPYQFTQEPWKYKKQIAYDHELNAIIEAKAPKNPEKERTALFKLFGKSLKRRNTKQNERPIQSDVQGKTVDEHDKGGVNPGSDVYDSEGTGSGDKQSESLFNTEGKEA